MHAQQTREILGIPQESQPEAGNYDSEFQNEWKGVKDNYDRALRSAEEDDTKTDSSKMKEAYDLCAEASRSGKFDKALEHVKNLKVAVQDYLKTQKENVRKREEETKKREAEHEKAEKDWADSQRGEEEKAKAKFLSSGEAGGDSDNDDARDLFKKKYGASNVDASIETALLLRERIENYQNSDTGKLVKALLDLNEQIDRLFTNELYYIAISKIPELESAAKACEFESMQSFLDDKEGMKKWYGLQDDYEAAAAPPMVNKAIADLMLGMTTAYKVVETNINNLVFDKTTTQQIAELKQKVAKVREEKKKIDDAKLAYDKAWGQIKIEFEWGRKSLAKMKAPPKLFADLVGEAENAYTSVREQLNAFDYETAKKLLEGDFKVKVNLIKQKHDDLSSKQGECDNAFSEAGKQSGIEFRSVRRLVGPAQPDLLKLANALDKALKDYDAQYNNWEFDTALGLIGEVKKAAKALSEATPDADKAARSKADAARDQVIKFKKDGLLDLRPQAEMIQMLKDLQGVSRIADGEDRKALHALLKTIRLDPKYREKDESRRQAVIDSIVGNRDDKEKFKSGLDNWTEMQQEAKLELLAKAHAKQCKTLKILAIPLNPVVGKPNNKGFFNLDTQNIDINTNNPEFKFDFAGSMDTIFHETMHWYQANLVEKLLTLGEPKEGDAEHEQILLFALNNRTDCYVPHEESQKLGGDLKVYEQQPQEAHAYEAGPDMAKKLLAKL
jgi:hypothetical protein